MRSVRLLIVGACLSSGGNIIGTALLENIFGQTDPIRIVAMYGQEDSAVLDQAFVALGFVFRNAHSDQSANQPAHDAASAGTRKRTHDGTCGDERPKAWNGECTDSGQKTQRTTDDRSRSGARRRAFRGFGSLFVGEFLGSHIFR